MSKQPKEFDILSWEIETDQPYWLDPRNKHADKLDKIRDKHRRKHDAKRKSEAKSKRSSKHD